MKWIKNLFGFCLRRVRRSIYQMIKKIKYLIIEKIDNDETCWAELVMWVEFRSFFDLINNFKSYKTQQCRQPNNDTPYAYCGKCDKTGKYYV